MLRFSAYPDKEIFLLSPGLIIFIAIIVCFKLQL